MNVTTIAFLVISFFCGVLFGVLWELITCRLLSLNGYQKINGLHFHHSLFGLLAYLLALVVYLSLTNTEWTLYLLLFGTGVIVQHTLNERKLVFVTKD